MNPTDSSMSNELQVSVLVSVFNEEKFLPRMLDSLASQTTRSFQLVVVNDASTDRTAGILAREKRFPELTIIDNEGNLGLASSLNRGLSRCTGDLIMRMDGDDVCYSERVEAQLRFAADNPDVVLFSSPKTFVDEAGVAYFKERIPLTDFSIRLAFADFCPFSHPTACFRASLVGKLEPFYDPSFKAAEDYDLWRRMLQLGKVANLPDYLIDHRRHDKAMGVAMNETETANAKTVQGRYVDDFVDRFFDDDTREFSRAHMEGTLEANTMNEEEGRKSYALLLRHVEHPEEGKALVNWWWKRSLRNRKLPLPRRLSLGMTCRALPFSWATIRRYALKLPSVRNRL